PQRPPRKAEPASHRLPALHRSLFGDGLPQLLPLANQLASFTATACGPVHEDPLDLDVIGNRGATFVGVDGVSFLTGH
ncbi:MAG: hypothetical protein IPM40_21475, partial [Gammaproteobacteria bacterium]|nr:hypothetical protein [Gammaproteobacteria bacterium]